jgi:hypothetical protein
VAQFRSFFGCMLQHQDYYQPFLEAFHVDVDKSQEAIDKGQEQDQQQDKQQQQQQQQRDGLDQQQGDQPKQQQQEQPLASAQPASSSSKR